MPIPAKNKIPGIYFKKMYDTPLKGKDIEELMQRGYDLSELGVEEKKDVRTIDDYKKTEEENN